MADFDSNVASPGQLVTDGYDSFKDFTKEAFDTANALVQALANVSLPQPPQFVAYTPPSFSGSEISLPTAPAAPNISTTIGGNIPAAPSINTPTVAVDAAPTFNEAAPDLTLPTAPDQLNATPPPPLALSLISDDVPDAPDINLPTEPSLSTISLPAAPTLTVPTFTAVVPLPPTEPPSFNLDYVATPYVARLQTEVEAVLRSFLDRLDQRAGMPDEIEQILFERARGRETAIARKAAEEATQEWSARGFTLPQGELIRRVDEVRARSQDAVSELSRQTMIQSHAVRLDNLKFAVQQGVVYEGQWITLHNATEQRALEAASAVARLAADYYNAKIAAYNARITAFNAQAEVYRVQLQAESQKLELYRGQLEAARLRGDLNEQQVRLYSERVRAQLAKIEVFRAQVEGFRARVDGVLAQVQQYRGQIDAYVAQVEAKRAEYGLYGEQTKAVGVRGDIYRASVQAFAERVRAYQASTEAKLLPARLQNENNQIRLQAYTAQLGAFRELVTQQTASTRAQVDAFEAQARIFSSVAGAEQARFESDLSRWRTEIEAARSQAEVAITNSKAISDSAERVFALLLEAEKAAAQIQAQIAAGAMSAVSLGASISSSSSYSQGKSVSLGVSYGVDGGDAAPPNIPYY
jgi:hypothetical protein